MWLFRLREVNVCFYIFNIRRSSRYKIISVRGKVEVFGLTLQLLKIVERVIRIGLNESQDRNCSSKQIQLPKAMSQEGNERVVCSRLLR